MGKIKNCFRDLFSFSYESEIKLALLFFILFLLLLNFGTVHLLDKTKYILENEHRRRLLTTSILASRFLDESSTKKTRDMKVALADLSNWLGGDNIFVLDGDGKTLFSSKRSGEGDLGNQFYGLDSTKLDRLKNNQAVASDFYSRERETYMAYYTWLDEGKVLMVETEAKPLKIINSAFTLDLLIRLVGLLVVVISTIFFIKAILKPYHLIKSKAKDARMFLHSKFEGKDQDIDFVVETFQKVIAELKEKEAKLQELYRQSDQKAKNLSRYTEYILGSMNSGLIICNTQGVITHFNKGAETILGLAEEEMLNSNYSAVLGEKSRLSSLIDEALRNHRVYLPKEMQLSKPNKERVWVGVSSSLIRDEDNRLMGVVLLINDLSDIKELQREVAAKDKMAALGEMAGGLAHQLRNSVAAILGFGKLLKKMAVLDQSNEEILDGIIGESNSTEEMLERFLSFAKPQSINLEEISLDNLLEDVLKGLEDKVEKWKVKVQKRFERRLEPVWGDKVLLRQCFQNLIQNAIEAIPQGGTVQLVIRKETHSSRKYSEGKKFVEVRIVDNGEGIPFENLERIFNPFFTSKEKGTGLGLSLVRKIVTMHDGRVEVESKIKKGSIFKVYLPMDSKRLSTNSPKNDMTTVVPQS